MKYATAIFHIFIVPFFLCCGNIFLYHKTYINFCHWTDSPKSFLSCQPRLFLSTNLPYEHETTHLISEDYQYLFSHHFREIPRCFEVAASRPFHQNTEQPISHIIALIVICRMSGITVCDNDFICTEYRPVMPLPLCDDILLF